MLSPACWLGGGACKSNSPLLPAAVSTTNMVVLVANAQDDFDIGAEEEQTLEVKDRPEVQEKLERRVRSVEVKILNPPRPGLNHTVHLLTAVGWATRTHKHRHRKAWSEPVAHEWVDVKWGMVVRCTLVTHHTSTSCRQGTTPPSEQLLCLPCTHHACKGKCMLQLYKAHTLSLAGPTPGPAVALPCPVACNLCRQEVPCVGH